MKPTIYEPRIWTHPSMIYIPGGGSVVAGRGIGPDWASDGISTVSHPALSNSFPGLIPRTRFTNTGATQNQECGIHNPNAWAWRGDVQPNGGFYFAARFMAQSFPNNCRLFVGLSAQTSAGVCATATGGTATIPNNSVGLWMDTGDANNLTVITKDNSGTVTTTQLKNSSGTLTPLTLAGGIEYEFVIIANPAQPAMVTLIYDVANSVLLRSQNPGGLPLNTAFMAPHVGLSNAANNTGGTTLFDVFGAILRPNVRPIPIGAP